MKQEKKYSRFICYGNAAVCVYGNETFFPSKQRNRKSIVRLIVRMFNKGAGGKARAG